VADVCAPLPFPAGRFGAVVDKGTLDSLLCGDESTAHAAKMCEHVSRALRPGGVFVVISYGTPDNRLCYLEAPAYKWKVAHIKIGGCGSVLAVVGGGACDSVRPWVWDECAPSVTPPGTLRPSATALIARSQARHQQRRCRHPGRSSGSR
jgi:hypothetical protein